MTEHPDSAGAQAWDTLTGFSAEGQAGGRVGFGLRSGDKLAFVPTLSPTACQTWNEAESPPAVLPTGVQPKAVTLALTSLPRRLNLAALAHAFQPRQLLKEQSAQEFPQFKTEIKIKRSEL